MRVCDRHRDRTATEEIIIKRTDERMDLCAECMEAIRGVLNAPIEENKPKRRGRPPKNASA